MYFFTISKLKRVYSIFVDLIIIITYVQHQYDRPKRYLKIFDFPQPPAFL